MDTFKAQLVKEGKIIKEFEEKTNKDWDEWRFKDALNILKPRGKEIRWYKNGKRILS